MVFSVVFATISWLAGVLMAFLFDVDIRGISSPRVVDVMSRAAVDAGVSPFIAICPVDSILKIGAEVPTFAEKILPEPHPAHLLATTLLFPVCVGFNHKLAFVLGAIKPESDITIESPTALLFAFNVKFVTLVLVLILKKLRLSVFANCSASFKVALLATDAIFSAPIESSTIRSTLFVLNLTEALFVLPINCPAFTLKFPPVFQDVDVSCLPLNVLQSADDNAPLFVAEAVGRLNVCIESEDEILKSLPDVPVTNLCTDFVKLFIAVIPVPAIIPDCCVIVNATDGIAGCANGLV
jgi:hypothetical protein